MNNQNAQNRNIVIGSFVLTDLIGSVFTRSKPITVTIIQVLFYASGIGYFTYKVMSVIDAAVKKYSCLSRSSFPMDVASLG